MSGSAPGPKVLKLKTSAHKIFTFLTGINIKQIFTY